MPHRGRRTCDQRTVRGQYRGGRRRRHGAVPRLSRGTRAPASRTETFVALKAEVENWRWAGVPFYLRTGKRLPTRVSEIVIQFRQVPHSIFPRRRALVEPNRLVIRLQPDEGIS